MNPSQEEIHVSRNDVTADNLLSQNTLGGEKDRDEDDLTKMANAEEVTGSHGTHVSSNDRSRPNSISTMDIYEELQDPELDLILTGSSMLLRQERESKGSEDPPQSHLLQLKERIKT